MEYKQKISKVVYREVDGIRSFIAKDNLDAANKVASRIFDVIDIVTFNPKIGSKVSERFGIKSDYLFFVVSPFTYIILYKVDESVVKFGRVIDGRRDCVRVLSANKT